MGGCVSSSKNTRISLDSTNITEFNLKGQHCLAYCVKVYDGDTYTFNVHSSIGIHRWRVRENHTDTPELKSKNPTEKQHALACRDVVKEFILHKYCILVCDGFEKYGRLLARVYIPFKQPDENRDHIVTEDATIKDVLLKSYSSERFIDVGEWLVRHATAQFYDGKKKKEMVYDSPGHLFHPKYIHYLQTYQNPQNIKIDEQEEE